MNIEDCFLLGKITKPHGYKGDVILYIDADQPQYYADIDCIYLEIQGRLVPHFLDSVKAHSSAHKLIVQLEGVESEAASRALGGANVFLPIKMLPKLDNREFYLHEVQGWTAVNADSGQLIGTIGKVLDYAMYPILEVQCEGKEVLIPLPSEIKINVDRDARRLSVSIPDGLLDVYLGETSEESDHFWDGEEGESED